MSTVATMQHTETEIAFEARGAVLALGRHHEDTVALVGPAGTGKSRGALEYVHMLLSRYPYTRALLLRQTRRSLSESGIVTYEEKVQPFLDGVKWQATKQRYAYPNGSILAVGGLDKPGKVLSSEWDIIVIQQAEEISEDALEKCATRINRPGRRSLIPFNQVILDVNPDAPTHWLRQRLDTGKTTDLVSVHEDNPALYDAATATWTPAGARYIQTLDALTGVRYLRYRKGIWAAAEGMVYQDSWDRARNLVDRAVVSSRPDSLYGDCGLPREWPRYLVIDFGYTHPFVAQWYAEDGDGRLYRYREIYLTHRLVEDHAKTIQAYSQWGKANGDPLPYAIICDHDAEDRATLERHLGMVTTAAQKTVSDGIQAVASRWRPAGDGKPRLYYLRDSLIERDAYLLDAKQPTCSEEEIESYIWDQRKEAPVKEHDHGMDTTRYVAAHKDLHASSVSYLYLPH